MPRQVNCKRMRPTAWTSVSRVGAVGCKAGLIHTPLCRSYADYRCFSPHPPPNSLVSQLRSVCVTLPLSLLSLPTCPSLSLLPGPTSFTSRPSLPPLCPPPLPLPLLNAPSGGFGYAGTQSSSQSQFSYSLSGGPRARTESTDVNDALYNLDRVLYGESVATQARRRWMCVAS